MKNTHCNQPSNQPIIVWSKFGTTPFVIYTPKNDLESAIERVRQLRSEYEKIGIKTNVRENCGLKVWTKIRCENGTKKYEWLEFKDEYGFEIHDTIENKRKAA